VNRSCVMSILRWSTLMPLVLSSLRLSDSFAQANEFTPPKAMRMCIPTGCANLTWSQDHYDGRLDNTTTVSSRYWIKVWGKDRVEIYGKTSAAADGLYPAEGVFGGRISPQGNSLVDAVDNWRIGPRKSGTMGFTLTWMTSPTNETAHTDVALADSKSDHPQQPPSIPPATPAPVSPEEQAHRTQICTSSRIRTAMQLIENDAVKDPNGAMLSVLASALTGVDASSGSATILDSKDGSDGGRYTSQDPGSFVCRGLFARGDVKISATDDADDTGRLTAKAMEGIMSTHPTFQEWFKVAPVSNGAYRATLLPSSLQLSQEYTKDFSFP
jgi:hypothetical protein